ncbi:MAG: hypothetical protein NC184_01235 [Roseburia sp.]|nr:hypothetical protein [Roseburia sp.]
MRRSYIIADWFYRLSHVVRRNRFAVLLYVLCCLLFLVIGVAFGINFADKTAYVERNGAVIFCFLRGDVGIVSFFFIDVSLTLLYCVFGISMFVFRITTVFSLAPCIYRAYAIGMHTCVIISAYSASALPMIFVLFVPIELVVIAIMCMLSHRCFVFASLNGRCMPSRNDVREYYRSALPFAFVIVLLTLVKAFTVALFGSALIGII